MADAPRSGGVYRQTFLARVRRSLDAVPRDVEKPQEHETVAATEPASCEELLQRFSDEARESAEEAVRLDSDVAVPAGSKHLQIGPITTSDVGDRPGEIQARELAHGLVDLDRFVERYVDRGRVLLLRRFAIFRHGEIPVPSPVESVLTVCAF